MEHQQNSIPFTTPDKKPITKKALRFNEGKLRWGLVDFDSLEPLVKVLEFGSQKYDDHNWKKGLPITGVCESLLRHVYAFMKGEDNDPESGLSHIGHIQCNAMFLAYYMRYLKESTDDRFIDKNKETKDLEFVNKYCCSDCNVQWEDVWSCMCDDKCPNCNKEIEPYKSLEINENYEKHDN